MVGAVAEDRPSAFLCRIESAFKDGQLDLAIGILSQAAQHVAETSRLSSNEVVLWEKFGEHLISTGEIGKLADLLSKMVKIHPWDSDVHSHMLFNLHHVPDVDPQMILDEGILSIIDMKKEKIYMHLPQEKYDSKQRIKAVEKMEEVNLREYGSRLELVKYRDYLKFKKILDKYAIQLVK